MTQQTSKNGNGLKIDNQVEDGILKLVEEIKDRLNKTGC